MNINQTEKKKRTIGIILTHCLMVIIGFASSWLINHYNQIQSNRIEKLVYIRQTAPLTLGTLMDLQKQDVNRAIQRLEYDLDLKIMSIGMDTTFPAPIGEEAKQFLVAVELYRKNTDYRSKNESRAKRIDSILANKGWAKSK